MKAGCFADVEDGCNKKYLSLYGICFCLFSQSKLPVFQNDCMGLAAANVHTSAFNCACVGVF